MNAKSWMAGVVAAYSIGAGAFGQNAVQWRIEDGGNGHWYQLSSPLDPPAWAFAMRYAQSVGGGLAVIDSELENQLLKALVDESQVSRAWIGLYDAPSGGWQWIDASPQLVDGWGSAACRNGPYPNDAPATSACAFARCDYLNPSSEVVWDDFPMDLAGYPPTPALIEWSADCNSDGVVDYGQIRAGELDDANGNNIPDCCEQGTPCACPADIDANGSVNGIDLAIILNKWGTDGGKDYPNADQNKDGTVNAADLAAVLNGWGPCS